MHNDDETEALSRKVRACDVFNDHDRETLRELVRVYRGWQFVARVVRGTVVVLGGAAGAVAAISALSGVL